MFTFSLNKLVMKKIYFLLSLLCVGLTIGCADPKKEIHKEISIEKKKINDSLVQATIVTKYTTGEKVKEKVEIIEGTPGEVNAQLTTYKKQVLQEQGEAAHAAHEEVQYKKMVKKIQFNLNPKSESSANGMVMFTEKEGQVTLKAQINGLSPGTHAIHVHEKADCSSNDGKSAGGHWNPTFAPHGEWGSETGFHRGDIGNFTADETGLGMITFSTDLWCIGCEDETKNLLGKAIIVHQGEDDLSSQPSGAAGARVSCAGIIQ
jgi:Cu-Zn family superoxide dismutase